MTALYNHGRYRIDSPLHRGEYASVLLAEDRHASQEVDDFVALKVLRIGTPDPGLISEEDPARYPIAMFRQEVQALEELRHPNVVRMLNHFVEQERGEACIALEYLANTVSLDRAIETSARPPLVWRAQILLGVAHALEAAHERGIIHRDVTPGNVLVSERDAVVKLADFGISKVLRAYVKSRGGVTLREFYTRPYASPEQRLRGEATSSGDWHAFGVLMAAVLAWQHPDEDFTPRQVEPFLHAFREELRDEALAQAILNLTVRCLNDAPHQRPKAYELQAALTDLLTRLEHQPRLTLAVTRGVHTKLDEDDLDLSAVFADLNDEPRALLVPARSANHRAFAIELYGRRIKALLLPDEVPGRLFLRDYWTNEDWPDRHEDARADACPVRAHFQPGREGSDASTLVATLRADRKRRDREKREQERKNGFLRVAQHVLDHLRLRVGRVRLPYRILGETDATHDRALHTTRAGKLLHLQLLGQGSLDDQDDFGDVQDSEEHEDLPSLEALAQFLTSEDGEKSSVIGERHRTPFGVVHAYDSATHVLTVRTTRRIRLPVTGSVQCVDMKTLTPLVRQERALDRFVHDEGANPDLATMVLHPERNTLGRREARSLVQVHLRPPAQTLDLVERALAAEDFFLIQGPPGTGKTTVITEVMAQILRGDPGARVLLTSQANEAVNNALARLDELGVQQGQNWRIQRYASRERQEISGFPDLEERFTDWVDVTRVRAEAARSNYVPEGLEDGATVARTLERWQERVGPTEDLRRSFTGTVQVFGVTCLRVPVLLRHFPNLSFDWVIVDEAAKATPAEVLVSLIAGKRFILVGDHRQLPPYLDLETEQSLREAGLDPDEAHVSLFERLYRGLDERNKHVLRRQYRMHPSIGELVSELYYKDDGGLEHGVSPSPFAVAAYDRDHRAFWLDVAHGEETQEGRSWRNFREAVAIQNCLTALDGDAYAAGVTYSVGVVAAYTAQKRLLQQMLLSHPERWKALRLRVDTVDAFQGKEDDVIVYSMVRASAGTKRFISDRRRLNVAFSRARQLLIIAGNRRTLRDSPQIRKVMDLIPPENILPGGGRV